MEIEGWDQWSGKEVAAFVSQFCGLPQYATVVGQNLSGLKLQKLAVAGFLSKGLSHAGICDYGHQRQIASDVAWLMQRSPEEVKAELKLRVTLQASTNTSWKVISVPVAPTPSGAGQHGRRRPVRAANNVPALGTHGPAMEAGVRVARERERPYVHVAGSTENNSPRYTPKPYSDEPVATKNDGNEDPELVPELTPAQKLRAKLATTCHEYEDMRGPEPWTVYGVRGVQELQAQQRASQERREAEEAAAAKIQAIQRGKTARQEVQAKRQQQLEIRSQRELAATKIQAISRGKKARKSVTEMVEDQSAQNSAATKIQAIQRGKVARRELEQQRTNAPEEGLAEEMGEGKMFADEVATEAPLGGTEEDPETVMREQEAAATRIQALHRGKQARQAAEVRQQKAEEEAAARRIQAVHRGKQGRHAADAIRNERSDLAANVDPGGQDGVEAEFQKEVDQTAEVGLDPANEGDLDPAAEDGGAPEGENGYDEAQEAAIVRIQSVQRGKQARQHVEAKREHQQQEVAATKIQAVMRGKAARESLDRGDAGEQQ